MRDSVCKVSDNCWVVVELSRNCVRSNCCFIYPNDPVGMNSGRELLFFSYSRRGARCGVGFYEVADQIIHFDNEISDKWVLPFLSTLFVYAAALYNTFFLVLLP